MTWAQDQRIAYIKQRIEAGEGVTRPDVAARFNCTIQTVTATFHECKRRYPGLMAYDEKAKAYRRAELVQGVSGLSWRERALAAEAKVEALTAALQAWDRAVIRTEVDGRLTWKWTGSKLRIAHELTRDALSQPQERGDV